MNKCYYSVNNWLVDVASGSILHLATGERKRLGEYQLKLLDILIKNAGKIFTREELTNLVWERRVIGNNSLPNAIHALRTALEDDGKMQRIIKTIPRKGYLLEAEYCCVVEKDEDEVNEEEEEIAIENNDLNAPSFELQELLPTVAGNDVPDPPVVLVSTPEKSGRKVFAFLLTVLLTAAITTSACWFLFNGCNERQVVREIQPGVYSNIQILSVEKKGDPEYLSANLYGKMKDSLYALNQQIKMKSVTMSVYFHSDNSALNYSFILANKCDKKQLVMAIYHWRTDTVQLNNLIIRETRRKLNELATCEAP
ncbi:winged helix-turn-helix domain-containing protein [Kluyvera intermedia]|jgi:DNA-binding winged helix-turn-helix (wHTH) protein|uniref:Transcriptional regulator n=1 Tax=Kluyvera intermedia TaxID=61648 RepID=A0ABX6DHS1_KLUIN|nr:transcriptional regulator [Kluyvera intermedia]QGH28224.1 transcriptional regulator [Kluyvera intermedia]QGH37206.1 transcriptional regulator [Kluyvera intermedia]WEJ83574.1 MAG: transcriptional regulator [Kluyvera intermedia]